MFIKDLIRRLSVLIAFDDRGATAIEYGLIVSMFAVGVLLTMNHVGTELNNVFTTIAGILQNAQPNAPG